MTGTSASCPGPITRRELLRVGSFALGGLSLTDLLAAREARGTGRPDTSVILLYLHGGASQLETYDLKPDAPTTHRSIFKPIRTNVPGMDLCEHLPLHARIANKFSLVRSLYHDIPIHSDGGIIVLTGKRPSVLDPTSQSKSEHPDFGSVTSRMRGPGSGGFPPYVTIPNRMYMVRPTYLGLEHGGFEARDPSIPDYRPATLSLAGGTDTRRLDNRRRLLGEVDRYRRENDPSGLYETTDRYRSLAFDLLTSPTVAAAFDLSKEKDSLRDRYGRNIWGQGCLLARRLAEAGAAVTTLYINTPKNGDEYTNWDDHIMNAGRPGHFGKYMEVRLPYYDQCLSALIQDLHDRGLDRKVMVVAVGEFGRTPRLSTNSNGVGRDHWPQAYTALIAGGGLKMGQVVGATDEKAEHPTDSPYTPQDLLATVYRHLGVDPTQNFTDSTGRPIPILYEGEPIRELV